MHHKTTTNEQKLNLTENHFLLFSFHLTYFPVAIKIDASAGILMFVTLSCHHKCTFAKRFKDLPELWNALWSIFSLSLLTLRKRNFLLSVLVWCLSCAQLCSLGAEIFKTPSGDSTFLARIGHKNTFRPIWCFQPLCFILSYLSTQLAMARVSQKAQIQQSTLAYGCI